MSLSDSQPAVMDLLQRMRAGDKAALDCLMPLVYGELKRLASAHRRKEVREELQTTELVHETFLRLSAGQQVSFESRAHFFGIASRLMRQVLVDASRSRHAVKRNGPEIRLASFDGVPGESGGGFVAIHQALERLEQENERRARLIEMRFFGGMTAEESAAVLALPVNVVRQQLRLAQAWLRRELAQ